MMSRRDLDRRVTELGNRMDWLDQHGTRGVAAIQNTLVEQGKDIAKLEANTEAIRRTVGVRQTLAFVGALLPLYALLIITIILRH